MPVHRLIGAAQDRIPAYAAGAPEAGGGWLNYTDDEVQAICARALLPQGAGFAWGVVEWWSSASRCSIFGVRIPSLQYSTTPLLLFRLRAARQHHVQHRDRRSQQHEYASPAA